MNPMTIWKCIIIFIFSIKGCPLNTAIRVHFNDLGSLTVKPAPPFLLGSNLTIYCRIKECIKRSKIFLELQNGKILDPSERISCTTAMFHLFNVQVPKSAVLCKLKTENNLKNVNGMVLQGGIPPDKPKNIICVTTKSSDSIGCSWFKGQETYLPTAYNISIERENGTQVLMDQIKGSEEFPLPRSKIDENTTYQLNIKAYNNFGASQSDPFYLCVKDVVIPETPHIIQLEFVNNSVAALLRWKSAESTKHLRSCVRLRTNKTSWSAGEGTELSEGLIKVEGLKPLTDYEFQIRTCFPLSGRTHINRLCFTSPSASNRRSLCSKWSSTVKGRSPGKRPSQKLHVWRIVSHMGTNGRVKVTVLWKPPSPEDYSGEVQHYIIFIGNDKKKNKTCAATASQCSVHADVQELSISMVTMYGMSPPADVPLRQSGNDGPFISEVAPAANGNAVSVSWSGSENKHGSASGEKLLHYVLEWKRISVAEQQWKKLDPDENRVLITGLTAGVRYKISLFAVTTRGVSAPSSRLVYSQEQKPQSSPSLSVLVHEARQIQIQWGELPVGQQRGFITNYTIYLQTLNSSNKELRVTVSGHEPRERWLDCPDGALALQMTASTSAGEGPRGSQISSQPAEPAVGLVIVMVFIITIFIGILSNLLCWSCVRESIKQKCISWGPACVGENLPKPGNSYAITLLKHNRSDFSFSSTYSDPPLSPVSLISQEERDDVYPNVHMELYQDRPRQSAVETLLLMSDPMLTLFGSQLEDVSYKPQVSMLALQEEEAEEEQSDIPASGQEGRCSGVPGELLGGLLSSVEVEFSVSPLGLTLSPASDLLWPKTTETISDFKGGYSQERKRTEKDVDVDSPCQDLQQGEIMICDPADTCVSQYRVETSLTSGYFPQVAAVSRSTHSDTHR